jgi:hypothetical protein
MRWDLRHVENGSVTMHMVTLLRIVTAVTRSGGAY